MSPKARLPYFRSQQDVTDIEKLQTSSPTMQLLYYERALTNLTSLMSDTPTNRNLLVRAFISNQ